MRNCHQEQKEEVKGNVRRNAQSIAEESNNIRREIRERTGIHSMVAKIYRSNVAIGVQLC